MTINFSLPNFFINFRTNDIFFTIVKTHPEFLKNPNVNFLSAHGQFPYCYWNGGININEGPGAYYTDFINCGDSSNIPLRFNFSNLMLTKEDFDNVMANLILDLNGNGSNEIELSNLELFNYLRENYPVYSRYIFSKNADIISEMTPEVINALIESDNFSLIELPVYYNGNFEQLKQIQKRKYIELVINPICNKTCNNFNNCRLKENISHYNYSRESIYCNCTARHKFNKNPDLISLEEIEKDYLPLGIFNFKIEDFPRNEPDINYCDFLVQYFIKPEYQIEALNLLLG